MSYKIRITRPTYIGGEPVRAGATVSASAEDACGVVLNLRGEFVKADDRELALIELRRASELSLARRGSARFH
jgi:hypothetical protein